MANDLAKDLGIKLKYFRNYNDEDPENSIMVVFCHSETVATPDYLKI